MATNQPDSKSDLHDDVVEPSEADWAEIDAWLERNKDALNESIRKSREQFARGEYHTTDEVKAMLAADRLRRARKD
jgi:hypothetical protein